MRGQGRPASAQPPDEHPGSHRRPGASVDGRPRRCDARKGRNLRPLIERIELDDDEVRMSGPIGQLERALEINDFQAMPVVPTSVEKWRAMRDKTGHRWTLIFRE